MNNLSDFWKWCILFAILIYLKKVSTLPRCELSRNSVKKVDHCPTDAASWIKAAEKKNCQSIEHNCSISSGLNSNFVVQYHCLVNSWMNATVEVCAFNRTILGFCAEYNLKGAIIQDNYTYNCTSHDPPCPKSYNSAEAYKYPTCYALAKRNHQTTMTASSSARRIGNTTVIFVMIIFGILIHV